MNSKLLKSLLLGITLCSVPLMNSSELYSMQQQNTIYITDNLRIVGDQNRKLQFHVDNGVAGWKDADTVKNDINRNIKISNKGLQNIGSTCYMNATLQAFANISDLLLDAINSAQQKSKNINLNDEISNQQKCMYEFLNVMVRLNTQKNGDYYAPETFRKLLALANPLFKNLGEASDAKDLLNFLIMEGHELLNMPKDDNHNNQGNIVVNQYDDATTRQNFLNEYEKTFKSPFSKHFYAIQRNTTKCESCNKTQFNYQAAFFKTFPLEEIYKLKYGVSSENDRQKNSLKPIDLDHCFQYDSKLEYFTGENQIYCNACKSMQNAKYYNSDWNLPNNLILLLNRGKGIQYKINPQLYEYIDLKNCVLEQNSKNNSKYLLQGIVVHCGESGQSGHFIYFGKKSGKWYQYNDALVSEYDKDIKRVLDGNFGHPYLLFYKKVDKQTWNSVEEWDRHEVKIDDPQMVQNNKKMIEELKQRAKSNNMMPYGNNNMMMPNMGMMPNMFMGMNNMMPMMQNNMFMNNKMGMNSFNKQNQMMLNNNQQNRFMPRQNFVPNYNMNAINNNGMNQINQQNRVVPLQPVNNNQNNTSQESKYRVIANVEITMSPIELGKYMMFDKHSSNAGKMQNYGVKNMKDRITQHLSDIMDSNNSIDNFKAYTNELLVETIAFIRNYSTSKNPEICNTFADAWAKVLYKAKERSQKNNVSEINNYKQVYKSISAFTIKQLECFANKSLFEYFNINVIVPYKKQITTEDLAQKNKYIKNNIIINNVDYSRIKDVNIGMSYAEIANYIAHNRKNNINKNANQKANYQYYKTCKILCNLENKNCLMSDYNTIGKLVTCINNLLQETVVFKNNYSSKENQECNDAFTKAWRIISQYVIEDIKDNGKEKIQLIKNRVKYINTEVLPCIGMKSLYRKK